MIKGEVILKKRGQKLENSSLWETAKTTERSLLGGEGLETQSKDGLGCGRSRTG